MRLYMRAGTSAVARMRALALGLLCALAQVYYTRAEQGACAPGSYWNASAAACRHCPPGFYQPLTGESTCTACPQDMHTSASSARSVVQCTCPSGTGLGDGGYEGGCSACTPGSFAPDAGPAFEFVGEGSCTGTCAHTKLFDSEGACALACVSRGGCVGFAYTHASSVCDLHWAQPRATEVGWTTIDPATACAGISGSTGSEGQACWRKDVTHPQTQLANLLHPPIFELVGDGYCRSGPGLIPYYLYQNSMTSSQCRQSCELEDDCIGFMHSEQGAFRQDRCYIFFEGEKSLDLWIAVDNTHYNISQSSNEDFGQCYRRHDEHAYTNLGLGYCRSSDGITIPYYHYMKQFTEPLCRRTCDLEDGCVGYMFATSGNFEHHCYVYYSFRRDPLGDWLEINKQDTAY